MRQAYDYWQDQPGSPRRREAHAAVDEPNHNAILAQRPAFDTRPATQQSTHKAMQHHADGRAKLAGGAVQDEEPKRARRHARPPSKGQITRRERYPKAADAHHQPHARARMPRTRDGRSSNHSDERSPTLSHGSASKRAAAKATTRRGATANRQSDRRDTDRRNLGFPRAAERTHRDAECYALKEGCPRGNRSVLPQRCATPSPNEGRAAAL